MSSEQLDAIGRVRLYVELSVTAKSMGWGIVFDARFQSEEWPRTAYALDKSDVETVLANHDRLIEALGTCEQKNKELRNRLDNQRVTIRRLQAELRTAQGAQELLSSALLADRARCNCGHSEEDHQGPEGLGGAQCKRCPGDDERSWKHPYTPEEGE